MKRLAAVLTVGASVSMASQAIAQLPESRGRHDVGKVISIALPANATLEGPSNGPDFAVYSVVRSGQRILSIYLGNASDFPIESAEFTKIEKCLALIVTKEIGNGKSGDVLIPIRGDSFPSQLHFFYRDASSEVARDATKVIASMRILSPRRCIVEHTQEIR